MDDLMEGLFDSGVVPTNSENDSFVMPGGGLTWVFSQANGHFEGQAGDRLGNGEEGTPTNSAGEISSGSGRGTVGLGVSIAPGAVGKEIGVDERAKRAEDRKERNRMSAAKSNVRRKIRNEELRKNLAEVRQKAAQLLEIERFLRAENVRLRALAHENKVNVSLHLTHIQMAPS